MGLGDGIRHYVKGIFVLIILIALVGSLLPTTFGFIDDAPEGAITGPSIVKLALSLIVLAFVIFQILLPGIENFKGRPPEPPSQFSQFEMQQSYNPYQGQGGFQWLKKKSFWLSY